MSDSTKRAERRDNEVKHWERRLKREYFENTNNKDIDLTNIKTFDEFKNCKCGEKLKNVNNLDDKDRWKDAYTKQEHKRERFVAKREIDNSIMEYNNEKECKSEKTLSYLREQLLMCNDEIFTIEQMLHDLPERLEGLKEMRKEIETEICWYQYGNS
jgi:hypothetical protein